MPQITVTQITLEAGGLEFTNATITARGTLAIAAAPNYAAGGITVDFSGLGLPTESAPLEVEIWSEPKSGSAATALFLYSYLDGTNLTNGKVQIWTGAAAQSGLAELANGAVPAGVTGDTIKFKVVCKKFQ
jgi:hypothetical protein